MVTSGYLHAEASKARGIEEKIKRTFEKIAPKYDIYLFISPHDVT